MDNCHRQGPQSFHGRNVVLDATVRKHIEQRAVIDRVSGKKDTAARFPETDAPRRMSRQMHDFQRAIAKIDYVAFLE